MSKFVPMTVRDARVYLPKNMGGFSVTNCPDAVDLAQFIGDTCNAHDDLVTALKEMRRAIGDHNAPLDCYATGPLTGDPIRDLIQCPACSAIAMHDAALVKAGAL